MIIILLLGITITVFVLFISLLYLYFKKQLEKKDYHIKDLIKSLTSLQIKLKDKERRKDFRLKLLEKKCIFEFVDLGDQKLERLKHRRGEGLIKDISRTGVQLICDFNLPIRKEIYLELRFTLLQDEFVFKGKIVRKEEDLKGIVYGVTFMDKNSAEETRLIRELQHLELERRKSV